MEIVTARSLESLLRDHPFIRGLDPKHVQALQECASPQEIPRGNYLWRQGDPAKTVYLLYEGEVSLGMTTPNEGLLRLETLSGGDVLGWSWILAPYRWHFDAYAVTAVRSVGLDAAGLRKHFEMDPELHLQMLVRLVPVIDRRLHATQRKLLDLYTK